MILLDKLTFLYKSGLALLLIPIFFACDDPSQLGLEVPDDDDRFDVAKVEFTLPVSTISIDSLRSGNSGRSIFGQINNSITGKTTATSYNRFNLAGGHFPDSTDVFIKAYLRLAIDDFKMTSALSGEEIHIHEAQDTLFESAVYLANKEIPYTPEPILSATFDFDPTGDFPDSLLTFDLPADFSNTYYNRLYRASTDTSGNALDSLLREFFFRKPLVLVPGTNNMGLYSIDLADENTGIFFQMENAVGDTTYTYRFDFEEHFSHITRDRSASQLSDLTEEYVPSSQTDTYSYIDVMAGIYPKVSLKPLLDYIETEGKITVNSALLELSATQPAANYTSNIPILNAYFISDGGKIDGAGALSAAAGNHAILEDNGYFSSTPTLLNITIDSLNDYKANMSLFTQVLSDNFSEDEDFLTEEFVLVTQSRTTLDETTLINSEVKLTLYYTTITE